MGPEEIAREEKGTHGVVAVIVVISTVDLLVPSDLNLGLLTTLGDLYGSNLLGFAIRYIHR